MSIQVICNNGFPYIWSTKIKPEVFLVAFSCRLREGNVFTLLKLEFGRTDFFISKCQMWIIGYVIKKIKYSKCKSAEFARLCTSSVKRGLKCEAASHGEFLLTHSCDSSAAWQKDYLWDWKCRVYSFSGTYAGSWVCVQSSRDLQAPASGSSF